MTTPVLGAVRGRPSNSTLSERLELVQERREELEAELHAERAENRDFAVNVRTHALHVEFAARADRLDLAAHCAGAIVDLADRHLRQRGPA